MRRRLGLSTLIVAAASMIVVLFGNDIIGAERSKRDLTLMPRVAPGSVPIAGAYWALIIGIDKYKFALPLDSAAKDAIGVRDVLVERYGFKKDRIIELLNEQGTRTNIEEALFQLGQKAGPEDSVLIYYAGHGQYDKDGRLGWWVPVEGQPGKPGTFITNASIRDYLDGMKARHVYLVADSCFSGTLFGKSRAMPPMNDQFFARLYASKSRWGLTSGGTEPVADSGKGGHSIFAYHLIKLLRENNDPYLVPSHIFDQIAPVIANNADQTPRSEPIKNTGDEGGQFVFKLVMKESATSPTAASAGLEAERQKLHVEREAFEREKREAEERAKLEAGRRQVEEEQRKLAEDRRRLEEERLVQQREEDRRRESERKVEEQRKLAEERRRTELERQKIEEARVRPYSSPGQRSRGKAIFEGKGTCFNCHGIRGKGDGPAGHIFNPRPSDLTNWGRLRYKTDGERFMVLNNGIPGTGMVPLVGMAITESEAWDVIAYLNELAGR